MKSVKILALCLFVLLHAISRAGEFTPKSLSDTLKEYDRTVDVRAYGAIPNDVVDDTGAIRRAISENAQKKGTRIRLKMASMKSIRKAALLLKYAVPKDLCWTATAQQFYPKAAGEYFQ